MYKRQVKIDANVDFEMQLPDIEWISESSTRGLSTHKKYLKIAAVSYTHLDVYKRQIRWMP